MLHPLSATTARPDIPAITEEEAGALARATVELFARWELSDREARALLGGMSARSWARWKAGEIGRIGQDTALRMSLLMGIHKGLRYLFSDPARGYGWIRRPNRDFAGRAPLDVMCDGTIFDLARVRAWLDASRGGW